MIKILIIGSGGFIGAVLRYYMSGYAQNISGSVSFPAGTLAVNVVGCFVIGVVSKMAEDFGFLSIETRMFVTIGLLGAFTTYSTFGYETLNLLRDNEWFYALVSTGLHLIVGIGAVWVGRIIVLWVWG